MDNHFRLFSIRSLLRNSAIILSVLPLSSYAEVNQVLAVNAPVTAVSQAQNMMIARTLLQKKYQAAIAYIDGELGKDPNNTTLLYKEAGVYVEIEEYEKALAILDRVLTLKPKDVAAQQLKEKIEKIVLSIPRNELGLYGDEAYVSDVGGYWNFASLHYYRFTKHGTYGARINYAKRYGTTGEQYQLEAYPTFENKLHIQYVELIFGYANFTQILYPNYKVSIEPYFDLPGNFEMSAGFRGIRSLSVNIYTYTGSLGYYWGSNYLWFRPYHYTPKSSDFFEVGIRHYFDDQNTYLSLKGGIGKAPDIFDLAPLNQIVVLDQDLVALTGQFPVYENVYLRAGGGYLRQVFPSGRVREITDGSLEILWRF